MMECRPNRRDQQKTEPEKHDLQKNSKERLPERSVTNGAA
jgi:hypothetical protein